MVWRRKHPLTYALSLRRAAAKTTFLCCRIPLFSLVKLLLSTKMTGPLNLRGPVRVFWYYAKLALGTYPEMGSDAFEFRGV
jgi:hypothetical protein